MMLQRDTLVLGSLGLLAAALVVLGILTVGGPETARAERRDQARLSDLNQLVPYVGCLSAQAGEALPEAPLPSLKTCAEDPPLSDRFDGAPYRYERLSAVSYRLCARFERPDLMRSAASWNPNGRFEPTTGCIMVTVPD